MIASGELELQGGFVVPPPFKQNQAEVVVGSGKCHIGPQGLSKRLFRQIVTTFRRKTQAVFIRIMG